MKAVILAGGFGTRISEYTHSIPKPMIPIGNVPILAHIIEIYAKYGIDEIIILGGYKVEVIQEYFYNTMWVRRDMQLDFKNSKITYINSTQEVFSNLKITILDTGANTMTGGRLLRAKKYLENDECFHFTYGDGLSNVNLNEVINIHRKSNSIATLTAVKPPARYGELTIQQNTVLEFKEKPKLDSGYINGGFFVLSNEIFNYLHDDSTVFEKSPLENLAREGKLSCFHHEGFWQSVDTKKEKDYLDSLVTQKPWI